MEIALRAFPVTGEPPPTNALLFRAQPETLCNALPRQCEQVGIGRAGLLYGANIGRQNNACAAAAVALSSTGLSR
jgi:hypothetical protein